MIFNKLGHIKVIWNLSEVEYYHLCNEASFEKFIFESTKFSCYFYYALSHYIVKYRILVPSSVHLCMYLVVMLSATTPSKIHLLKSCLFEIHCHKSVNMLSEVATAYRVIPRPVDICAPTILSLQSTKNLSLLKIIYFT